MPDEKAEIAPEEKPPEAATPEAKAADDSAGDKPEEKAAAAAGDDEANKAGADDANADDADEGDSKSKIDWAEVIPEGSEIDEAWVEKLEANPTIQKLAQDDVKGLIGMVGEFVAQRDQASVDAHEALKKQWATELEADDFVKDRGMDKVKELAEMARNEYFAAAADLLTNMGLMEHPTMVVGLSKIAEHLSLAEGKLPGGGAPLRTGEGGNAAHKLFKDYAPGGKYA